MVANIRYPTKNLDINLFCHVYNGKPTSNVWKINRQLKAVILVKMSETYFCYKNRIIFLHLRLKINLGNIRVVLATLKGVHYKIKRLLKAVQCCSQHDSSKSILRLYVI